jgi:hypothetical protein
MFQAFYSTQTPPQTLPVKHYQLTSIQKPEMPASSYFQPPINNKHTPVNHGVPRSSRGGGAGKRRSSQNSFSAFVLKGNYPKSYFSVIKIKYLGMEIQGWITASLNRKKSGFFNITATQLLYQNFHHGLVCTTDAHAAFMSLYE